MDSIKVSNIRAYGYTGYLPAEQVLGQWFRVDLTLYVDLTLAGQSDRLEHTLDYRQVINLVKEIIQIARYALVERLAESIAAGILGLKGVAQVRVELTKLSPPIPDFGGEIRIDITRSRS